MKFSDLVPLMVFVNDPDTGSSTGRMEAVSICDSEGEILLGLNCVKFGSPNGCRFLYSEENGNSGRPISARIGRMKVRLYGIGYGVGNWCWDRIWVSKDDAARILNCLRKQQGWGAEEGIESLMDKWKKEDTFKVEDFGRE